jgi:hypothetical protein
MAAHTLQVGRFVVKGQPNPVEIVEVALQHLAPRRFLLPDNPPKSAKGRLLEPLAAKCAAVPAVCLPALALRYRQQHVQRETAAAAAAAAAELMRRSNNNKAGAGGGGLALGAAAGGVGVRTSTSRSSSFTSMLRQRSMPVSVLASRDVSLVSAAASAGSGGGLLRVVPRQGSWMARAFSIGSGSGGGSSSCSSPRGGMVQLQVLGQRESVQEDEEEGQQQEGSV